MFNLLYLHEQQGVSLKHKDKMKTQNTLKTDITNSRSKNNNKPGKTNV